MVKRTFDRQFELDLSRELATGEKRVAQVCREHNLCQRVVSGKPSKQSVASLRKGTTGSDCTRRWATAHRVSSRRSLPLAFSTDVCLRIRGLTQAPTYLSPIPLATQAPIQCAATCEFQPTISSSEPGRVVAMLRAKTSVSYGSEKIKRVLGCRPNPPPSVRIPGFPAREGGATVPVFGRLPPARGCPPLRGAGYPRAGGGGGVAQEPSHP
jgi:hypothetical protein